MDEDYEGLSAYCDDPVHDMYVDYDDQMNTGEFSECCDDSALEEYMDYDEEE